MDTPIQPGSSDKADELDGAIWRKSSYSGTQGNCVEVAVNLPGIVAVRDSKNPENGALVVSPGNWHTFLSGIQASQFAVMA